jgi:ATP-binding cassette subfamily C protein
MSRTTSAQAVKVVIATTRRAARRPLGPRGADADVRDARFDGAAVEFHGVTFGYGARAEPVVRNLSLTIPSGTHCAVVGPSGTGKSTLASLTAGLSRPYAGVVRDLR